MKPISQMLQRLRSTFAPRRGKKGSSLALVMMIGAVLVIWVMCIMPLMTTTGTITYQTQGSYDDYLQSRSVIEFCKSELEKIVEERIPYTFAVTGNVTEENFTAEPKYNVTGHTVRPEYAALVNSPDALDDRKDVPSSDEVAAICAVEPVGKNYQIVITTWHDCEKAQTYTATFTPTGSLRIFPESYGAKQALPLSDFVLVDGQLGKYTIWNSNNKEVKNWGNLPNSDSPSLSGIVETLLPWILNNSPEWSDRYANAGAYPAVFKTTANAAASDENSYIGEVVTDGEMTSEIWIEPVSVRKDAANKQPGNIWYDPVNDVIRMQGLDGIINITNATIYHNGTQMDPSAKLHGTYQLSIDYPGTGEYVEGGLNVLPVKGLQLPDLKEITGTTGTYTLTAEEKQLSVAIEKVEVLDADGKGTGEYTLTATLTNIPKDSENLLYGCLESGGSVVWSRSPVFENLTLGKTYFFYVCRPASIDEKGVFHAASEVAKVGMIYKPEYVTTMEAGTYIITTSDEAKYLANATTLTGFTKLNEGYIFGTTAPATWTVSANGDNWQITQNGSSYLDLTGEADYSITREKSYDHGHWAFIPYPCYKATFNDNGFKNLQVSSTGDGILAVTATNDGGFEIKKELSQTIQYKDYYESNSTNNTDGCSKSKTLTATIKATAYLNLNDSVSATETASSVKFAKVSIGEYPNVTAPSTAYTLTATQMTYGNNAKSFVQGHLTPGATLQQLYTNGTAAANVSNSGVYSLMFTTDIGTTELSDLRAVALKETLTVKKADLANGVLSVVPVHDENDEMSVIVTCSTWHENGGEHYFGYRLAEESGEDAYHWFPAEGNSYTFRLDYGTYVFAVKESGSNNHNGMIQEADEETVIEPQWVDLSADQKNDFIFTYEPANGESTWYKLPSKIYPSRVQLVFGIPTADGGITWTETYSSEVRFYGAVIPNTPFGNLSNVLQLSQPVGITSVNDHQSSMMRGSSLYFMSESASINTYGNSIYLTTDLLVLNSPIVGDGKVFVEPYTPNDGLKYTLLFNPNPTTLKVGSATLAPYTVYKIEAGKDLNSLTNAYLSSGDRTMGEPTDEDVLFLIRKGSFPEINLDIAYATGTQLASIVSGETIGWTNLGKLGSTNADEQYYKYAVCAYVSEITSGASNKTYSANRVLIAGETESGADALVVPYSLSFAMRYLSLDTGMLQQQNSSKFIVYNLEQKSSILGGISTWLGISDYTSKSLQVDYERSIQIIPGETLSSQIYRYDDGTDLFSSPTGQSLTIDYDSSELTNGVIINNSKIVDRYISISGDDINLSAWGSKTVQLYTNYIHFDSSVDTIGATSAFNGDLLINCQEAGYGDEEYLYFFRNNSAEKYKGTLIYFENDVRIRFWSLGGIWGGGNIDKTIPKGFYYVFAKEDGTSIKELADLYTGEHPEDTVNYNKEMKPYAVDKQDLANYSIYVNEDGTLSDAYVDTGLEDNNSTGVGGFSGGKVG